MMITCRLRQFAGVILFLILLTGVSVSAEIISGFTGVPTEGPAPLTVTFLDESQGTSNITGYLWSFGDRSKTSEEMNPVHTYAGAGWYNISLTVHDKTGANATVTKDAYIHVRPSEYPIVRFAASPPDGTISEDILFLDQSELDPGVPDEMYTYLWDFDDGTNETNTAGNTRHRYAVPGEYSISLEIQDDTGAWYRAPGSVLVNITNSSGSGRIPEFSALFTAVPSIGPAPLKVSFIDQSTSTVPITNYRWDFGDGSAVSNEKNPVHTYLGAGRYPVTLTIANANGNQMNITVSDAVRVQPSEYPAVKFTAIPLNGTAPKEVYFLDQSELDPGVPEEMYTYLWDFGDGKSIASNARNVQHVYTTAGSYPVSLQIQDQNGARYAAAVPLTVNISNSSLYEKLVPDTHPLPGDVPSTIPKTSIRDPEMVNTTDRSQPVKVAFDALPLSGEAPLTVSFIDQSTCQDEECEYLWIFGDGCGSDGKNPVHTYSDDGLYTVTLTITSKQWGSDTVTRENLITVMAPTGETS